jgi:hypothetical protein
MTVSDTVEYAYRVLMPPSRREQLDRPLAEFPDAAAWIVEGYRD